MNLALPRKVKRGFPGELTLELNGKSCTSVCSEDQCIYIITGIELDMQSQSGRRDSHSVKNNSIPPQRAILWATIKCLWKQVLNWKLLYKFKIPFIYKVKESKVAQSCLTLCNPMDCRLPGSSIHGIFPARRLEWVAISSRWSAWLKDRTWVSCIAGRLFTIWATRESLIYL